MDKTETRDLGIQDINTENKKTLWLTKMHEGVTSSNSLSNSLYRGELFQT